MKKMKILTLFFIWMSISCSVDHRPIEYGKDHCAYCEMTVMDKRYGTEIVTTKGKVYTFDSIECLVNFLQSNSTDGIEAKLVMVTPFTRPGTLVEAESAWYLQSGKLPSPMGMYLTAFDTESEMIGYKDENGGFSFTWTELLDTFPSLDPARLK